MLSKERILSVDSLDSDWDVFIRDEVNNNKKAFFTGKRFVKLLLTMQDNNHDVTKADSRNELCGFEKIFSTS